MGWGGGEGEGGKSPIRTDTPVQVCRNINSFLAITGKVSVIVIILNLLCVFGSRERHSECTEELSIPLRPIPKEDCLRLLTGQLTETGRLKVLIHGRKLS